MSAAPEEKPGRVARSPSLVRVPDHAPANGSVAPDAATAEEAIRRVERALRMLPIYGRASRARRVAFVAGALARLGARARDEAFVTRAAEVAALSIPGMREALASTLTTMDAHALDAFVSRVESGPDTVLPRGVVALVLSANVVTAPVRALALPLLLGNVVLAKASPRDDVLAQAFAEALCAEDAELADALALVTATHEDEATLEALLAPADVVAAYGSDATLEALRARLPRGVDLVAHGHGLGVGFVPAATELDERARRAAALAFARDVALYDQRGCLSPHAIFVEGSPEDAEHFAEELSREGLAPIGARMPRAKVPFEHAGALLAYRGIGLARGRLFEDPTHVVASEREPELRPSVGYRTVQVLPIAGRRALFARLAPLGRHLKVIGVASDDATRASLVEALPRGLAPRVVAAGAMQTPPFDVLWDGELPEQGLVRRIGRR